MDVQCRMLFYRNQVYAMKVPVVRHGMILAHDGDTLLSRNLQSNPNHAHGYKLKRH